MNDITKIIWNLNKIWLLIVQKYLFQPLRIMAKPNTYLVT